MKKYVLFLFLITLGTSSLAQTKFRFFLNTGYTFNADLELNGAPVSPSHGYVFNTGLMYRLFKEKKIRTEIGLGAKFIFSSGKVADERFGAETMRLLMPIKFSLPIAEKWRFSAGWVLQNNLDFSKFDFKLRDKYSWRMDAMPEIQYLHNELWTFTFGFNISLRSIPDPFYVNDPKTSILIGVIRPI